MFAKFVFKVLIPVLAASVAVMEANAQPVDPAVCLPDTQLAGLARVLEHALAQSPEMLQHNIELARADASVLVAHSAQLPSVASNGRYAAEAASASNSANSVQKGFFYSIALNQPLFYWGEIKSNIEISELDRKIRQKAWQEAYRGLAASLRGQYLGLIIQKRALAAHLVSFELQKRARKNDEERHAAGLVGDTEFAIGGMALEEAAFGFERAQYEFAQARRIFARLAGFTDFAESEIPDDVPVPPVEEAKAESMVAWFTQSGRINEVPSVQSIRYLQRRSELSYKVASTRLLPKFNLSLSDSQENNTFLSSSGVSQGATHRDAISLSANWNIFDGFATRAVKRMALADGRDADLKLKTTLQGLDDQSKGLITRFSFATRSLSFAERRYALAKGGLDYLEAEVKAGRQSPAAVDSARSTLLAASQAVLGARADVFARWGELMGLLWLDPVLQKLPTRFKNHGN